MDFLGNDAHPPRFFRRQDESDDAIFYREPRLLVHLDENAILAIEAFLNRRLPRNGTILDLMSSWRSHLPTDFPKRKLVGLGLNATELTENPQLDEYIIHDLNQDLKLPFDDQTFDAVILTVSIQYLIRPVEIFREINRIVRTDSSFHIIYSDRMFSTKAVAIWRVLGIAERAQLIHSYFHHSGSWQTPKIIDITPDEATLTDPVHVVTARKV